MSELLPQTYRGLHVKYLLFLPDFIENQIFLSNFGKVFEYHIWRKFVQWEPSCSMLIDKQDEAHISFREFCECAKDDN